ncbi:amino acid transporter [Curvibacter sp. CHRR-16]|uniref:LysE/ArgO family amino acid transporter n=1 Tax=Curvibacter sp. CHRR-16 TaxID=2835872 RepID=UPI001BDAB11F|nr:LysE/ArgO family amino acid transporter [Curvibacter sp. CHRR-16]MBT0570041.1 amino acid transporter [Curvibacter sp. CHRR-16]
MNDTTSWTALSTMGQGMALSLGLIVAIGAQNAFVLRQGLRREHVGSVVLFCMVGDALLMSAGVLGMAQLLGEQPQLTRLLGWGGALFLAVYGLRALNRALHRARQPQALQAAADPAPASRAVVLAQAAAFTLLNPHVYLDTVVLVGSLGAQHPAAMRGWFVAGGSLGSALWFALLGYGAGQLAPVFAKPKAWLYLDALVGLTMLGMAVALVCKQP